jgi:hypothetical protein
MGVAETTPPLILSTVLRVAPDSGFYASRRPSSLPAACQAPLASASKGSAPGPTVAVSSGRHPATLYTGCAVESRAQRDCPKRQTRF